MAVVRNNAPGLVACRQGDAIGGAMNGQRQHHGTGNLAEMMRGGFVEMAGGAGRTNVVHVFADKHEDGVARSHGQQDTPPVQRHEALRQDGEEGHAQERARAKADQRAQPFV